MAKTFGLGNLYAGLGAALLSSGSTLALSLNFDTATISSDGTVQASASEEPIFKPDLPYTGATHKRQWSSDGVLQYAPHNLYESSNSPATQTVTVVNGAAYKVSIESGAGSITLSGAATGTVSDGSPVSFTASSTSLTMTLSGSVTGPSLRRTPSPDTYIETTSATPVYGPRVGTNNRKPVTNLLSYPQNLDNAAWTATRASVSSGQTDPLNGTSAYKLIEDSTAANTHVIVQSYSLFGSPTLTHSVYAKAGERTSLQLYLGGSGSNSAYANFDLSAGETGTSGGAFFAAKGIAPVEGASGWYRCWITHTGETDTSVAFGLSITTSTSAAEFGNTYDGDGSSGIFVYNPQVNEGGIEDAIGIPNLVSDDKDFSQWTNAANSSVTTNSTAAPDGTTTADTIGDDSSTGTGAVSRSKAVTFEANKTTYVYAFLKEKQLGFARIRITDLTGLTISQFYNLSTGATGTAGSDVTDSGATYWNNGWYLCWLKFTNGADTSGTMIIDVCDGIADATVDLDGTSDIYAWGAFAGHATSLPPYPGMPQTDYVRNGYLAEAAATNLVTDSEDLSAASWTVGATNSVTVTTNQSVFVDGLTTMDRVEITDTTNEAHTLFRSSTVSAATNYCYSGFFRGDEKRYVNLRMFWASTDWATVTFDMRGGAVTQTGTGAGTASLTDYGIIPCGSGVYRFWMVAQDSANTTLFTSIDTTNSATPALDASNGNLSYAGTAGDGFFAGGLMVETGTYPSSYIATSGGTATRNADVLTETALDWFNAAEGTLIAEGVPINDPTSTTMFTLDDGTANEVMEVNVDASDNVDFDQVDGGTTQNSIDSTVNAIVQNALRVAAGYKVNDNAFSANGNTAVDGDGTASLPTVTTLTFGAGFAHNKFKAYNTLRSNAELAEDSGDFDDGTALLDERAAA